MTDNIQLLRESIDNIDRSLISLLAERFSVTRQVGQYKQAHGLPAIDKEREAEQFARIQKLAKEAGLDPDFADRMLRLIIDEVIKNHNAIARRARK